MLSYFSGQHGKLNISVALLRWRDKEAARKSKLLDSILAMQRLCDAVKKSGFRGKKSDRSQNVFVRCGKACQHYYPRPAVPRSPPVFKTEFLARLITNLLFPFVFLLNCYAKETATPSKIWRGRDEYAVIHWWSSIIVRSDQITWSHHLSWYDWKFRPV